MRTNESNKRETHIAVLSSTDPNAMQDSLIEQIVEGDDELGQS